MWIFRVTIVFFFLGVVIAQDLDIDINRIKRLPFKRNNQRRIHDKIRRNIIGNHFESSYAHSHNNSKYAQLLNSRTLKIHPPREDPRMFYQSGSYIKENGRNVNKEVSAIYPGREVTSAQDTYYSHSQLTLDQRNQIDLDTNICVRCPNDRTIIAKSGSDRVILDRPILQTCSGQKAPRSVHIISVYGPKFDSLLEKGLHVIIGKISSRNKAIRMCKMQVNVIVQDCPVPKDLISKCDERNKVCTFTCRDPQLELNGNTSLSCGDNMGWRGWTGDLPTCRVRSWCSPPTPPSHGHLSCKGATFGNGSRFAEGSTCRIRCPWDYHWHPRAATACRRGVWTFELNCQAKRFNRQINHVKTLPFLI